MNLGMVLIFGVELLVVAVFVFTFVLYIKWCEEHSDTAGETIYKVLLMILFLLIISYLLGLLGCSFSGRYCITGG